MIRAMKSMNKACPAIAATLISIVLFSCGGGVKDAEPRAAAPPAAPAVATLSPANSVEVAFLQGSVLIDGKETELGAALPQRFIVQTGPGARCDLIFNGGNVLSVGQNGLAEFDFASLVATVRLESGGLSSVLKKLESLAAKDSFIVNTETAVAGVRGTSFCVWVDDKSSYICACNGAVRTIDANGSNEELLEASHHAARLYSKAGAGISKETAAMLHHTDELLESVASRIGYVIDWTRIDR
jgi:ferric-dicitrate binding protein FerR (iron transport regulator)